ncbi:cell wall-binding repeat-containing protein [Clostridium sp. ATCC 25772]|uniref:cell wall-binding repeat-containing protein n=1 Tax=Clostridium sp. ATCC 25772 TaxID=1676991 RepID=UPI000782C916|nr:cell wall-binding repeat-containing protein [Clostridium sp. ATCC 25772]
MGKKSMVISTLLIGATLSTMGHSVFAVESKETIERKMLAGEDRYETAVKVSKHGWTSAKNVVLVNSTAISDALAATPFAKLKDAPILLTTSKALTDSTKDELKRLQTENVYIVGGGSVISKDVVKELNDMGIKTERIFGSNREETAIAIAKNIDSKEVAVVNGYTGLADALSIAPVAADKQMPILISSKDDLGKTGEYIKEKNIESSYVLGEKGVISEEVEKSLPKAERIGGENRRETNSKVLEKFYSEKEFSNIYVAKDGSKDVGQLVDALSISTVAGKEKSPLVLVGKDISGGQKTYLESKTVKTLYEVGNGINANTVENIIKALSIKEVTPEPDPDPNEAAKVHSVKAINGIQLEVKFNKPVDEDSATDLFNYEIKDEDNKDVLNDSKNTSLIELKEDKKTAIITLRQDYGIKYNQVDLDVEVSNVYTEDKKEKVADFKSEVRVLSTGLPELLDIKQVGPKEYNLTFSEPVTAKNSNEIRNALRVNKEYPSSIETRIDNPGLDANVVRMITSSELKDGEHELSIKDGIYNYGGFKCEEGSKNFTVVKDESNITATVDKVKSEELTLKFNKSLDIDTVEDDNVEFYLDYVNKDYKLKVKKVEDNKVTLSYGGFPLGDHKIVIKYKNKKDDKIKDLWGKELEETSISYNLQGETAPTVKAEYNRFNKTIDLKFSKAVTGADDYESYILTNADGDEEDLEEVEIKCKDDGKKEYTIDASDFEGKYTLEIVKNKIRDTTVARVPVEETSLEIEVADTTEAKVKMVTYGGEHGDQIFVRFSEAMRTEGTGSVLDKKNYLVTYNGGEPKQLDEIDDAKIDIKGDNDLVQITLPDKIDTEKEVKIHIGSVADANGKFTGLGGNSFDTVGDDRELKILAINSVEDLDVEQQGNIAVKDDSTIEFYVDREILLLNQKNVEFKLGSETLNPSSQEIEEDEDLDGNIVYKVTLEFDEEIFNTDGKIDYKDIKTGTIQFKEEAFTTINESVSKKIEFDIDNNKPGIIVDKAAPIIKTATILGDKKIQLDFSEEVNSNHISASTFEIEDYDVEKIEKGESEKTIILVLDKEITENSIKVKQVQPIRDKFKNKTTDMEKPTAKYHGPIVEKAEIDDTKNNIIITFKEEIDEVSDISLKEAITMQENSVGSVKVDGKTLTITLTSEYINSTDKDVEKTVKINAGALKNSKDDFKSREINEKITIKAK